MAKSINQLLEERHRIEELIAQNFERKLALLFIDVWGYTSYVETRTAVNGLAMLKEFFDIVNPIIEKYAGVLVKKIGDEAMVAFTSPISAARASIAMQQGLAEYNRQVTKQNRIHAKIGVDYGEVLVEAADIHGDTVNVASRVTGLGGKDQILFTGFAWEPTRDVEGVVFRDYGIVTLKGKEEPVNLYELVWRDDRSLPRIGPQEEKAVPPIPAAVIEPGQFESLTRYFDKIYSLQFQQVGKFSDELSAQGKAIAKCEPRIDALEKLTSEELKPTVEAHTKSLSRITGAPLFVSFLLGLSALLAMFLAWFRIKS